MRAGKPHTSYREVLTFCLSFGTKQRKAFVQLNTTYLLSSIQAQILDPEAISAVPWAHLGTLRYCVGKEALFQAYVE